MSVSRPDYFTVRTAPTGALELSGELDGATIHELQDRSMRSWSQANRSFLTWPTSLSSIAVPCIVWSGPLKRPAARSSSRTRHVRFAGSWST
jgi:hypothetical protein